MASKATISGSAKGLTERLLKAAAITTGDLLQVVSEQRSRILDRTARGVDFEERPFAPYNSTRPYYYYPQKGSGRKLRGARASGRRLASAGRPTAKGFRFESYAAFHQAALGSRTVTLRDLFSPHMLDQIELSAGSYTARAGTGLRFADADQYTSPAQEASLSISGEAGSRASGHNSDQRPKGMPLRRFFDASESDIEAAARTIEERVYRRMAGALKG